MREVSICVQTSVNKKLEDVQYVCMKKNQKIILFITRLAMGWLFFYAGITKVLNPDWSASGYLEHAQAFPKFFMWFASPENIGWVNIANEWGLTLIGALLILGLFVRWTSFAGILLMLLYYFPVLNFPLAGEHSYIVDEHIIYILVLLALSLFNAGRYWGLDQGLKKRWLN